MIQRKAYLILIVSMLLISLTGCDQMMGAPGPWQATVYTSQGEGKMIGEYETRDECQMAAQMHIAQDKKDVERKMSKGGMSFNCALVN